LQGRYRAKDYKQSKIVEAVGSSICYFYAPVTSLQGRSGKAKEMQRTGKEKEKHQGTKVDKGFE
jgi:hypothetical protein